MRDMLEKRGASTRCVACRICNLKRCRAADTDIKAIHPKSPYDLSCSLLRLTSAVGNAW